MYLIEKNVPMPKRVRYTEAYPCAVPRVGDTFGDRWRAAAMPGVLADDVRCRAVASYLAENGVPTQRCADVANYVIGMILAVK